MIEKIFDFSADPIPIIAVGFVDVQEPTLTAAWNSTDHDALAAAYLSLFQITA